jgi:hypothetical protein
MQVGSTDSAAKQGNAKAGGKGRQRGSSSSNKQTLQLKDKQDTDARASADLATTDIDMTVMIATAAYYIAEQRGFEPGHELDDWLTAEQQVRTYRES